MPFVFFFFVQFFESDEGFLFKIEVVSK